jgi:hypothetical protein
MEADGRTVRGVISDALDSYLGCGDTTDGAVTPPEPKPEPRRKARERATRELAGRARDSIERTAHGQDGAALVGRAKEQAAKRERPASREAESAADMAAFFRDRSTGK